MKITRYIFGIILTLATIGLVLIAIQETCEFDMARLGASAFLLIFFLILFFVFMLISVFKARKWQGIILIILSSVTVIFMYINVSFDQTELFKMIPFILPAILYLVYGLLLLVEATERSKKK